MARLTLRGLAALVLASRLGYDVLASRPEGGEEGSTKGLVNEDQQKLEGYFSNANNDELDEALGHFGGQDMGEDAFQGIDMQHINEVIRAVAGPGSKLSKEEQKRLISLTPYFAVLLKKVPEEVQKQISEYLQDPGVLGSVLSFFHGTGADDKKVPGVDDKDLVEAVEQLPAMLAFFDSDSSRRLVDDEKINLLSFLHVFAGNQIDVNKELLQRTLRILKQFAGEDDKISRQEQEHLVIILKTFAGGDVKLGDDELGNAESVIKTFMGQDDKLDAEERTHLEETTKYFTLGAKLALDDMENIIASISGRDDVFNKTEQEHMLEITYFFAGEDGHLSQARLTAMNTTLQFFAGADDKLDAKEQDRLLAYLKVFARDGTQLDEHGIKQLEHTFRLFAEKEASHAHGREQSSQPTRIDIGIAVTVNGRRYPIK